MPDPANLTVSLNATRRRMARSMIRLFEIIAASDSKLYDRPKPKAFLPIFPRGDATLEAAINTVKDRLESLFADE